MRTNVIMDLIAMEKEPLSFKYNTCRVDVQVAGMDATASGYIYATSPNYAYNYVFTAKHTFQEEQEKPDYSNLKDLVIRWKDESERLKPLRIDDKQLDKDVIFFDDFDFAIIRIPKRPMPFLKRIVVKNISEVALESKLSSDSFISALRKESTRLGYCLKDKEKGIVRLDYVWDVNKYYGASGSGIYCNDEPCLVGVLAGYRLEGFEQNEVRLSVIDWGKVNEVLQSKGWSKLNRGNAACTSITQERDVIDARELVINGASLNMERALARLQHDLTDDWYFDPLHYVDLCKTAFVLDYFSTKDQREHYKPERMEVFYLPKKSFVLRKAMVGTFVDRLVYTAAVNHLGETIDRHLSNHVFSARYNADFGTNGLIVNGVEQWTKMNYHIYDWVAETNEGCVVRLDLLNYYDTINKSKLIGLLNEISTTENEKACVRLLETLLVGFGRPNEMHGIPQNCDASSLLATFYVSHVDEFVLAKAQHYCRFMDDMYFMAKDKYEARDLLQSIEKHLREIDLSLNAQKVDFFNLDKKEEKEKLMTQLSLYDHEKTEIKHLVKSDAKARRMNGVALLVNQLYKAINGDAEDKNTERALKFSIHALTSYKLELYSYWDEFYKQLEALTVRQVDAPDQTPLICRLAANVNKNRNIENIKSQVEDLVTRKKGSIYEWQAYHLWMLLAHFKYKTPELVKYAAQEIEKNDETKTVEVASIFIYMVTVNPEYARILLHRLRDGQLHGNLQKRCALIAIRALDSQVIDEEALNHLSPPLQKCHSYLNKQKDKSLVFFHHITSNPLAMNESVLFPEFYSGL